MRFKERNELADRCKEWMKDQIENNITMPLDTVHMVLAYLDVNGYLNKVVRCRECKYRNTVFDFGRGDCTNPKGLKFIIRESDYCSYGERKEE